MTIIVPDASTLVAWLVDAGQDGEWTTDILMDADLVAPHLVMGEAANILRRAKLAGAITDDVASLAHVDLLDIDLDLRAYETYAERIWELRDNLTTYDAWYVAVAEALDAPLATLDVRLSRAPGPACEFLVPPSG